MLGPARSRTIGVVTESVGVYLLEAYATGDRARPISPEELRSDLEAHPSLRLIGFVVVPLDEVILCLVAAESSAGEAAIRRIARRYGAAARLLQARWAPGEAPPSSATVGEPSPA